MPHLFEQFSAFTELMVFYLVVLEPFPFVHWPKQQRVKDLEQKWLGSRYHTGWVSRTGFCFIFSKSKHFFPKLRIPPSPSLGTNWRNSLQCINSGLYLKPFVLKHKTLLTHFIKKPHSLRWRKILCLNGNVYICSSISQDEPDYYIMIGQQYYWISRLHIIQ